MRRPTISNFSPDCAEYFTCCQTFHVKTGACVIAALELLCLTAATVQLIMYLLGNEADRYFYMFLIVISVTSLVCASLFAGIRTQMASLLMPQMVLQIICAIACFVLAMVALVFTFAARSQFKDALFAAGQKTDWDVASVGVVTIGLAVAVVLTLAGLANFWLLSILETCYVYFKDRKLYLKQCAKGIYPSPVVMVERQRSLNSRPPSATVKTVRFPVENCTVKNEQFNSETYYGGFPSV